MLAKLNDFHTHHVCSLMEVQMKTFVDWTSHLFINTNLMRVTSQDMSAFLNLKLLLYSVCIHIFNVIIARYLYERLWPICKIHTLLT